MRLMVVTRSPPESGVGSAQYEVYRGKGRSISIVIDNRSGSQIGGRERLTIGRQAGS